MRERVRQGAYSVGIGGVALATQDLRIGAGLIAVAAVAIAFDERLTRSELIPWGGR